MCYSGEELPGEWVPLVDVDDAVQTLQRIIGRSVVEVRCLEAATFYATAIEDQP